MKLGATISSTAHVAILLWGAYSYQGVKKFEIADVEAIPVEFIPIESVTRSIEGDTKATKAETPAPKPTKKPPTPEPAENIGDSEVDVKSTTEAPPKPVPVEASAPPPEAEKPEPTPVPTNEVASLSEPPAPVPEEKIDPEPAKAEDAEQFAALPDSVPLPVSRPKPPQPKTAKTQKRKKPDEVKPQKSKTASKNKNKSSDDKIAALLNKQDPAASGKKRSSKQASLGARKSNNASRLSRSEMDALRGAIEQCWNVPIGLSDAEDMRVTITMNLAKDGTIDGRVNVKASGGESRARRAFSESARRAVLKCAPYNLPNEKYDTWSQVIVNFDPSQMF
ncbi:MAG: hypothetical protein L3J32_07095 [Rhizobiaceae bacterium]|nr:hypothetical protein [Rhizobiaceae bacterium]